MSLLSQSIATTRSTDHASAGSFELFVRLASRLLHAPIAVVSITDEGGQSITRHVGLSESLARRLRLPPAQRTPLVIDDTSSDPLFPDAAIGSYLGVPLLNRSGDAIGSLCVIDRHPRHWQPGEIELLQDLAAEVSPVRGPQWNEVLLHQIANVAPLAFFVVDNRTDDILYFNHQFSQIWNVAHLEEAMRRGEMKNQDVVTACLPLLKDADSFAASCQPLQSEQNRQVVQDHIAFRDGRTIARFSAQIRDDRDQYVGRLYVFEDVTQRERAKSLAEGNSRVLQMLARGKSLGKVLSELATTIERLAPQMLASILLLDEDAIHLRHGAAPSLPEEYNRAVDGLVIGPGVGSCGSAAFSRRRVVVDDVQKDPRWEQFRALAEKHELRACWSQPILSGDARVLGTFAMYYRQPRRPTDQEIRLIESAAHLAGIAIERTRAEDHLRRAKDAAEAADKAKDQFLAVLSHELRTPLTPAMLLVSALEGDLRLPDDARQDLSVAHEHIRTEARLIDDLLDLTRIGQGTLQLRLETVDAHACLQSTLESCRRDADAKDLHVSLELTARQHHARADPARIRQIFWNLLSNAIKFTPAGGRIVVRSDDHDELFRVQFTDSGVGIEPQVMNRLFGVFEQAEKEMTRSYSGLGLGLAISKALTEQQGGTITAHSAGKGRGSTVTVMLPSVPPPARPADKGKRPLRVLLVEDHHDTLRVLNSVLSGAGYECTPTGDVASAINAASAQDFDLLISDIALPDGSGLEIARRLAPMKAIALSGYGADQDVARARAAGFDEHITKPVDRDGLLAAVRRVSGTHADA